MRYELDDNGYDYRITLDPGEEPVPVMRRIAKAAFGLTITGTSRGRTVVRDTPMIDAEADTYISHLPDGSITLAMTYARGWDCYTRVTHAERNTMRLDGREIARTHIDPETMLTLAART